MNRTFKPGLKNVAKGFQQIWFLKHHTEQLYQLSKLSSSLKSLFLVISNIAPIAFVKYLVQKMRLTNEWILQLMAGQGSNGHQEKKQSKVIVTCWNAFAFDLSFIFGYLFLSLKN